MNYFLGLLILSQLLAITTGSDVVTATEKSFNAEVLKHPGIVVVEFFAPWCGHCKALAPEYEKAATLLKGVAKLVAVDASDQANAGIAQKYGVQGFPTLKVFGADKKKPVDYQGPRTSDGIVTETMKNINQLVKDRKKGGSTAGAGGSKSSSTGSKSSGSSSGSKKSSSGGSEVVELTDLNFDALVMDSTDVWLVEFFAPWCGHCQKLAPEWEEAAKTLKGQVKLGAVDATVHTAIAQKYAVKGYPTIKVFKGGPKKKAVDYQGPREAQGIIQHALEILDQSGVPAKINQITNNDTFNEICLQSGKFCVLMFVPHIYDSNANERNKYIELFTEVSKSFRGKPILFGWSEGGTQPALESSLEINAVYPSVAVFSGDKKLYNVQRVSWSEKNVKGFISGVLSGTEKINKLDKVPGIEKVSAWDGKDAHPPAEEEPLDMDWDN